MIITKRYKQNSNIFALCKTKYTYIYGSKLPELDQLQL